MRFLSEGDREIIARLIDRERNRIEGVTGRREYPPLSPPAAAYIIKTPATFPALDKTGTPEAGKATCAAYLAVDDATGNAELGQTFEIDVLNLGGPIGHAAWGVAVRENFGRWVLASVAKYELVYGLTTAAVAHTAATFNLDNVVAMQGPSPLADPSSAIEQLTNIVHVTSLPSNANAPALAWFDHTNGEWKGIPQVLTTDCEGTGTGTG